MFKFYSRENKLSFDSFELFNDMFKYLLAEILIGFDITIESEMDKLLISILIASESGNPMCRVWLLVNKY